MALHNNKIKLTESELCKENSRLIMIGKNPTDGKWEKMKSQKN